MKESDYSIPTGKEKFQFPHNAAGAKTKHTQE
jgi:hypothetical protein